MKHSVRLICAVLGVALGLTACVTIPARSAAVFRFDLVTTSDWTVLALSNGHEIEELVVTSCGEEAVCTNDWRHVNLGQPLARAESELPVRVEGTMRIRGLRKVPLEFEIGRGHLGYTTIRLFADTWAGPLMVGEYTWSGISEVAPYANRARFVVDVPSSVGIDPTAADHHSEELDQDNLYGTCCVAELESAHLYQQIITSGADGRLSSVIVEIHDPRGAIRFSLYERAGNGAAEGLAASPVYTQVVDTTHFAGNEYRWNVLDAGFELQPGTVFAVGLECVSPDSSAQFANDEANQYEGGDLLVDGQPFDPPMDLAFQTYVVADLY
jgi:hypothetical protein